MIENKIKEIIDKVVEEKVSYSIDIPNLNFGDYSTNVAMKLASLRRENPAEIASNLIKKLNDPIFESIELAGGFINFKLNNQFYSEVLEELEFKPLARKNEKILIEFGSANPTGPLHIGHGMQIIIGDILSSALEYAGYDITREYYINDYGVQIDKLAEAVKIRVRELKGEDVDMPDESYHGDYVKEIAKEVRGDVKSFSILWSLNNIRKSLAKLDVTYDSWFSEKALYEGSNLNDLIALLKKRDFIYEKDLALWAKTTIFGDDKDRVLIKADKKPSYFTSDLLYSKSKVDRSFDSIITLFGADHHGYVSRYLSSFKLFDFHKSDVLLIQLVNLFKSGEKLKMSKREGNFYSLDDLIDEVGKDACRFFFISRRSDSPLDFDLNLANSKDKSNPLFYVQYAYARICSLVKKANLKNKAISIENLDEKAIIKHLDGFNNLFLNLRNNLEVHKIYLYTYELATLFHAFYNSGKIVGNSSRLQICMKVKEALKELFKVLKIEALESM